VFPDPAGLTFAKIWIIISEKTERGTNVELTPVDLKENRALAPKMKHLYRTAFPPEERLPWWVLRLNAARRDIGLTAWMEGDRFCGFTASATVGTMHFLLFFAVAEELRGMGYGSRILTAIRRQYPTVTLNIELLDPAAPNYPERRRRYRFYRKNGFFDTCYHVWEVGGKFRVLGTCPVLDVAQYRKIFRKLTLGLWKVKILKAEDDYG